MNKFSDILSELTKRKNDGWYGGVAVDRNINGCVKQLETF